MAFGPGLGDDFDDGHDDEDNNIPTILNGNASNNISQPVIYFACKKSKVLFSLCLFFSYSSNRK